MSKAYLRQQLHQFIASLVCQFHFKIMENVHDDGGIYDEVGQVAKESFKVAENSCYGVTNTQVTGAIKGGESASNKKVMVMLFL